jgi:opacity protein-like surface antigen
MKRLALAAFLVLGTCASLPAQQTSILTFAPVALPSTPSAPRSFNFSLVPELAPPASASSSFPASPNSPAPQGSTPGEDIYRWDLAIGYEFFHFHSAPFSANLNGFHTDLTYNLNNWFGLEGSVVSAFGGSVFSGETVKSVLYTAGGRINAGPSRRRLTPWAHALIGGIHMFPQVAGEGRNGFALQLGGGADWAYSSRIAFRAEADYVRTMLYSSSQNNFQIGIGAVVHF